MTIEYQRTIEDIQILLSADTDPTEAALKEVYERYVDAVTATNVRLDECDGLLNQGLRAEAIHKSEMEPSLLDLVGILDFPERPIWSDYVRQFGLPEPPEPKLDVAQELNEAYGEEEPLTQLMRVHRLHALARSPLRSRIEVMRKISQLDAANPIWQQDIKRFEQARLAELPQEVNAALKASDAGTIGVLQKEVSSPDWLESPPQPLITQVANAHHALGVKNARAGLQAIAADLNEAYGNFDVDRARELRRQWDQLASTGIQSDSDELLDEVGPALDWLEEQDAKEQTEAAYEAAVCELERGLDKNASRQDLDRLYHAVVRFDRGIPDLLAERLQKRVSSLEGSEKRRLRLVVAGAAVAVILVALGVTALVISNSRDAERRKHVGNLETLVQADKLTESATYLSELEAKHPRVYESAEIQELKSELEGKQNRENGRKAEWDGYMATARDLGVDNFTFESFYPAKEALAQAEKISAHDNERRAVELLEDEITAARTSKQNEVDDAFRIAFTSFENDLEILDPYDEVEIDRMLKESSRLKQWPSATSSERRRVDPLVTRLNDMKTSLKRINAETALVKSITHSVGNRLRFVERLQAYVDHKSSDPARVASFRRVLGSEPKLWEGLEKWNSAIATWSKRDLIAASPADAKQWSAEAQTLMSQFPGYPAETELALLVKHLENVAGRNPVENVAVLQRALNNDTIRDIKMLLTRSGDRYYFPADKLPKRRNDLSDEIRLYYYKDFNLRDLESTIIKFDQIASTPTGKDQWDCTSPQARFSASTQDLLVTLRASNWNSVFDAILDNLQKETQMEPLLKVQLFDLVLEAATKGDAYVEKALAPYASAVSAKNSGVDTTANWIDPTNDDGKKARKVAEAVLARLPRDFDSAFQQAETNYQAMKNPVIGSTYQWIGWLEKNGQQWTCSRPSTDPIDGGGELFVLHRSAGGQTPAFERIGSVTGGRASISTRNDPATLVEGRPIYLKTDKS